MSTQITASAEVAREQHRDPSGKFGVQPTAEAATSLGSIYESRSCPDCNAPSAGGATCRACLTDDAREAAAAGTTGVPRLQLTGAVGDMDPQTGYLSMVAHIAEVDPAGVRERYGLDENASRDNVITAAQETSPTPTPSWSTPTAGRTSATTTRTRR